MRHTEKWRLALETIDEMAGPGGWGLLEQASAGGGARPVVTPDAGYGDNTTFRLELESRDWLYVLAVRGTTSAYPADAEPVTRRLVGRARPAAQARLRQPAGEPAPARHRLRGQDPADHLAAGHQGHQRQP